MTIVEFLTARYDELQTIAEEAKNPGVWITEEEAVYSFPEDEHVADWPTKADARHAAEWHPAYVLADIAAKRAIIETCARELDRNPYEQSCLATALADETVSRLALPFAGHPDYDESWRP